ncbi:hypothetical protein [Sporosarcina sp. FSL K6-5500]|uniref:hypothetical protein n=1 Tax=Sporosarcina sp. FSL K6-5500 TaxID=2921558 RepID=UPI0030F4CE32
MEEILAAEVNDHEIILTVKEVSGTKETYTDDTIAYDAAAFKGVNNQVVSVQNAVTMTDKANPILIAASTSDSNWSEITDILTVTYSEAINASARGNYEDGFEFWSGDIGAALGIELKSMPFNMISNPSSAAKVEGIVVSDTLTLTIFAHHFIAQDDVQPFGIKPDQVIPVIDQEKNTITDNADNNIVHSIGHTVTITTSNH